MKATVAAAIAKGFQDAAGKAGVHAIVLDAQGRVQKQANDIDDLIGQKVSGIALMPLDSVIAQSWVDHATAAGIPVVAVGSQVGDPRSRPLENVYPGLVALVTQDEVAAGVRVVLGNSYRKLGLFPPAERHLAAGLDLRRKTLGDTHRDTLAAAADGPIRLRHGVN